MDKRSDVQSMMDVSILTRSSYKQNSNKLIKWKVTLCSHLWYSKIWLKIKTTSKVRNHCWEIQLSCVNGVGGQTPTRQPYALCISKPYLKINNKPFYLEIECFEKDFYRNTKNSINTKNNNKKKIVFKTTEKQVICYQTDVFTVVIDWIL